MSLQETRGWYSNSSSDLWPLGSNFLLMNRKCSERDPTHPVEALRSPHWTHDHVSSSPPLPTHPAPRSNPTSDVPVLFGSSWLLPQDVPASVLVSFCSICTFSLAHHCLWLKTQFCCQASQGFTCQWTSGWVLSWPCLYNPLFLNHIILLVLWILIFFYCMDHIFEPWYILDLKKSTFPNQKFQYFSKWYVNEKKKSASIIKSKQSHQS